MASISDIVKRCKCGVLLSVNEHRDYYETVAQHLEKMQTLQGDDDPLAESEVIRKMIELDTVVHLQFYPDTPVASYSIYHHDVDSAIREAMEILSDKERQ